MTTMISNLPRDLIEEIISRVPLKSMKAVRLTCKSWNNLSKSESFTKMHIGKVTTPTREGETMMIAKMSHYLYLMSVVVDDDPSIEVKGKLSFLNNQVNISEVFHYEGLLLCILEDATRVLVWNPYLGQTRWIKLRYSHCPHGWDMFSYALGYEDKESCRSLKILRFVDYFYDAPEKQFFWYEIYDFDSCLWTTLDVTPHWAIHHWSSYSVSLKGNSYWWAQERSLVEDLKDHIICFDFTRERFGPLLPLPPSSFRDHGNRDVTLFCVKEEKIAAIFHYSAMYNDEFEIWITTKIEAEMVSWSKFLSMDIGPDLNGIYSFFIEEQKKVFMGFCIYYYSDNPEPYFQIIEEDEYCPKELKIKLPADRNSRVCSYVPSLVQIKKPARSKRIEESSLEKLRFDQHRLRLAAIEKLICKQYLEV